MHIFRMQVFGLDAIHLGDMHRPDSLTCNKKTFHMLGFRWISGFRKSSDEVNEEILPFMSFAARVPSRPRELARVKR